MEFILRAEQNAMAKVEYQDPTPGWTIKTVIGAIRKDGRWQDFRWLPFPTEARKFFRDDEMRFRTPGRDAMRARPPSVSKAWGSITIVVIDRSDDVAWDHHRSRGTTWRYDEGDCCSRAQRYRPDRRAGVDACATERKFARPAPGRVGALAGSSRCAGMVRRNRRGVPSETLVSF
jgi:hypothetical protein